MYYSGLNSVTSLPLRKPLAQDAMRDRVGGTDGLIYLMALKKRSPCKRFCLFGGLCKCLEV